MVGVMGQFSCPGSSLMEQIRLCSSSGIKQGRHCDSKYLAFFLGANVDAWRSSPVREVWHIEELLILTWGGTLDSCFSKQEVT